RHIIENVLWNLDLRTRASELPLGVGNLPHGFAFRADRETLLWCTETTVRQRPLADPVPVVDVLESARPWCDLVIAPDDRHAAALVGRSGLELWDLRER